MGWPNSGGRLSRALARSAQLLGAEAQMSILNPLLLSALISHARERESAQGKRRQPNERITDL